MKQTAIPVVVVTVLLASAAVAAAEPVRPVFHEETGRVWGEMADHFRGLGAQLERHLRGGPGATAPGGPPASPAERPLISFMLDHRADLALTPEQTSRLEALRAEFAREAIRREAEIRIAELDLAALLERDPLDLAKTEAKIHEVAKLRSELRVARLRTIEQGKAVLTPEQRTKLQGLLGGPPGPRRTADRVTRL